ncbi:hypothetical protein D3C77_642500 [compost metagenome]
MVTTLLGAGELQAVTHDIEQYGVGRNIERVQLTVDVELKALLTRFGGACLLDHLWR